MKNLTAVVLAAGKGSRINAREINKVMLALAGKPMIGYTYKLLKTAGFKKIIVVVGFAKDTIINFLGKKCSYAYQQKRLGTAHALKCALSKVPLTAKNVFVCYSDDTAFYPPRVIINLIKKHLKNKAVLTFLTVEKKKPDIARVLRDDKGRVVGVVELHNLKPSQKKIKEINCGCYCVKTNFLKKFLPKIKKNPISGEYDLPKLIELGLKAKAKVQAFKIGREDYFQGVNTRDQLIKADKKMKQRLKEHGQR